MAARAQTARAALDLQVSERDFQAAIVREARLRGWLVFHVFDSRRSTEGFPDLVLVRAPRVVFAELKRQRGRVSAAQRVWLQVLEACSGVEVYEWRPADRARISEVLA